MFSYINSLIDGVIEHYAALTGIVFVAAILKLVFPVFIFFLNEITNRVFEKRSEKRFKDAGLPSKAAKKHAEEIWRPTKERNFLSRLIDRLILRVKNKASKNPPK
ncbi:hypothetical protein [Serratia marcescens]|uniref:hypothetical protein n=1 Tax=Serratia marcescens TaxID=615 RepID=UPI0013A55F9D|nr:hypothetical protein [Serratia marcescens]